MKGRLTCAAVRSCKGVKDPDAPVEGPAAESRHVSAADYKARRDEFVSERRLPVKHSRASTTRDPISPKKLS